MSALTGIRDALASALDAVAGLSAYEVVPGKVNVPAAVVAPDSVEYHADFDGGATYRLPVQFLVALGDWGTAQRQLDALVAHDGTATNAIDNNVVGYETRAVGMEQYGLTSYAGTDYLGAQIIVEVLL